MKTKPSHSLRLKLESFSLHYQMQEKGDSQTKEALQVFSNRWHQECEWIYQPLRAGFSYPEEKYESYLMGHQEVQMQLE